MTLSIKKMLFILATVSMLAIAAVAGLSFFSTRYLSNSLSASNALDLTNVQISTTISNLLMRQQRIISEKNSEALEALTQDETDITALKKHLGMLTVLTRENKKLAAEAKAIQSTFSDFLSEDKLLSEKMYRVLITQKDIDAINDKMDNLLDAVTKNNKRVIGKLKFNSTLTRRKVLRGFDQIQSLEEVPALKQLAEQALSGDDIRILNLMLDFQTTFAELSGRFRKVLLAQSEHSVKNMQINQINQTLGSLKIALANIIPLVKANEKLSAYAEPLEASYNTAIATIATNEKNIFTLQTTAILEYRRAQEVLANIIALSQNLLAKFEHIAAESHQAKLASTAHTKAVAKLVETATLITACVILFLTFFLSLTIIRIIQRKVKAAIVFADAIAQGDLGADSQNVSTGQDELGLLGHSLIQMQANLQKRAEADATLVSEVNMVVSAANEGDLDRSVELFGKEGAFLHLSQALNQLLEKNRTFFADLTDVLGDLANGKLDAALLGEHQGVFRNLQTACQNTIGNLRETIGTIQNSAMTVAEQTQEIEASNHELSQRTEQQAASITETSSTITELAQGMTETVSRAEKATSIVDNTSDLVTTSMEAMEQANATMQHIRQSSEQIETIVNIIDEIAFQTNLLALNAAVEAARAGEQGRGFAVVASEVRALSGRSAASAKEIRNLIVANVEQIQKGVNQVERVHEQMNKIVEMAKMVNEHISAISERITTQTSSVEETTQAISEIEKGTQRNAALVEELATATSVLNEQARALRTAVSQFELSEVECSEDA